jgi:hypothetical protein
MSMPLLFYALGLLGLFAVLGGLLLWRALRRAIRAIGSLPACNDDFHWL